MTDDNSPRYVQLDDGTTVHMPPPSVELALLLALMKRQGIDTTLLRRRFMLDKGRAS